MAKVKKICESNCGQIVFDPKSAWFYFIGKEECPDSTAKPLFMYRIGCFDLTPEETSAIKSWLTENLKDGVFQN